MTTTIHREDFSNKDDFIKAKLNWIDENRESIKYTSSKESKRKIKDKCNKLGIELDLD